MTTIGFSGGPTLSELGSIDEVQLFFDCIASYAVPSARDLDWTLLTDRLYRKCITVDQAPHALALVDRARTVLDGVASSAIARPRPSAVTKLDWTKPTLGGVFAEYVTRFSRCTESAELYCVPTIVASSKPPQFYRPTEQFEVGDRIDHALFGQGVVERVDGTKITVCFESARRILVHGN